MENRFDFSKKEEEIYKNWEEKGYFKAKIDKTKNPFVISMPPPNVTAKLHIGHALDNTIQDIFIRYNRLKGIPSLWVPGTDHASIATEVKVVEKLKKEGKTKESLGREGFLKEAWAWKEMYGGQITAQLRKLGCSCDWEKERFTMDEGCSKAVNEVFVRLYNEGLIYKGKRIVNWCPCCKTSISETEVEYNEEDSYLWYIKYPVCDSDEYIVVATSRPETMLGDNAVAVNPKDERYKHLVGKKVLLPLANRQIPVIADHYVDVDFGTGAVKITMGHDPNDFEVGKRHNLEVINILNEDGTMNENALKYKGQTVNEARKNVVEDLEKEGYLVKTEKYTHNVGSCYRCHTTIEPYVSNQWFVKMKELVKPAIEAVKNGEVKFVPKRFEKTYFNWMENIQDWCISRQLWWGHRIPAYYCDKCGNITVSKQKQEICDKCGSNLRQDDDTLDTWFSSALWPFSTLGFPENTEDYNYFYPTSMIVTGYDIITFWVSKMIFSGIHYTSKVPFNTVYIHGLVRDSKGRKMSKSLGNGVDPIEIINEYGTDALRFSLIQNISLGNDIRFMIEKVENARNFVNKLWNAAKFVNMYVEDLSFDDVENDYNLMPEDKWILTKLNTLIKQVEKNMDKYEIGVAITQIYDFIWFDFCDWYIEMVKPRLYNKEDESYIYAVWTLNYTLNAAIKLLHPFMPYITEEIYQNLKNNKDSIMLEELPKPKFEFAKEEKIVTEIMEIIRNIRNIRAEKDIPLAKKFDLQVVILNQDIKEIFEKCIPFVKKLAYVQNVMSINDKEDISKNGISLHFENFELYLDLSSVTDKTEERNKLIKEKNTYENELKRANSMLANEKFVANAKPELVEKEKEKQIKYKELLNKVEIRLNELGD